MNAVNQWVKAYVDEYANTGPELPGQALPWLRNKRIEALNRFSSEGFPSPRLEEWKYTNILPIERKLFAPVAKPSNQISEILLDQHRLSGSDSLVFVDGFFSAEYSSMPITPGPGVISSMAGALKENPGLVEKYYTASQYREEHGFIHFNTAYFTDGCFVFLPAESALAKPLQLIYVSTQQNRAASVRNIVVLEREAKAELIETHLSTHESGYLSTAITEISLADNAHLNLFKFQCESNKAFHVAGTYVNQAIYSVLDHHSFSFGGALARNEVHSYLGRSSECYLNGLYLCADRQHCDNHTRIHHIEPEAISRELYKGIMDDKSRGVFQGRVIVNQNAQKTDSNMNNRNLLLSADAEADTKPQLEIYADDVKCTHGVTVGQLDQESIFYLSSRGIGELTARNMLIFAFANEMVEKINNASVRAAVQGKLLKRFPQKGIPQDWL